MEAFLHASSADDAFPAVKPMAAVAKDMRAVRADRRAIAALDAFVRQKRQLRLRLAALRIVAPSATKGASLQKNGRPDARAVVHGEAFYINQSAFHRPDSVLFVKFPVSFPLNIIKY